MVCRASLGGRIHFPRLLLLILSAFVSSPRGVARAFLLLPTTQPYTRGAPKRRLAARHLVIIPHIAKQKPCFTPLCLSCHYSCALLPYLCHSTTLFPPSPRHPSLHNTAESHNPKLPSPQLRATLPAAEQPPQHVQTPRKNYLFQDYLPAHLVTRIVSICPPNISLNAIPRYPPAAWPSSPTNKYCPTGYS